MQALSSTLKLIQVFSKTSGHLRAFNAAERKAGKNISHAELSERMIAWAKDIIGQVGIRVHHLGEPPMQAPGVLIGNHVSYVDIPVMMSLAPTVFVSKAEVGNWPILGRASKRIGTVLVKRSSAKSRVRAVRTIAAYLEDPPRHLTVFPAGTTSLTEELEWRWRIFEIAAQSGVKIQPFRIRYHPLREVAFIDKDLLLPHLWKLLGHNDIEAFVEFGEPFTVTSPAADAARVRAWAREPLLNAIKMTENHPPTNDPVQVASVNTEPGF